MCDGLTPLPNTSPKVIDNVRSRLRAARTNATDGRTPPYESQSSDSAASTSRRSSERIRIAGSLHLLIPAMFGSAPRGSVHELIVKVDDVLDVAPAGTDQFAVSLIIAPLVLFEAGQGDCR